jgi:hypothetical protein
MPCSLNSEKNALTAEVKKPVRFIDTTLLSNLAVRARSAGLENRTSQQMKAGLQGKSRVSRVATGDRQKDVK